jgi:hypothetical protein
MSLKPSASPRSFRARWALAACILVASPFAAAGDGAQVVRLSEPVEVTATHETFGAAMPAAVDSVALSALVANYQDYADSSVVVEARVAKVCQKKGCFFIARDGATTVRVSFKDYSFFVPTDISGREVTLAGELRQVELTKKQAEHLEADLGAADAAVKPGPQFEIVATSVRVPKG